MWPIKEKLKENIWFEIRTTDGANTRKLNVDEFMNTLTRKQIKLLNKMALPYEKPSFPKQIDLNVLDSVYNKMKPEFEEADHIKTDEDYKQYIENCKDQMMLSKEEEEKLLKLFGQIEKVREEVAEKIKSGEIDEKSVKMATKMAEHFIKSATKSNK